MGIYQMQVSLGAASRRPGPRIPRNPADPAYHWPSEVDYAIRAGARAHRIRVSLMLTARRGGRTAAGRPSGRRARRATSPPSRARPPGATRSVHLWQIWGEPSRQANFKPMPRFEGRRARGATRASSTPPTAPEARGAGEPRHRRQHVHDRRRHAARSSSGRCGCRTAGRRGWTCTATTRSRCAGPRCASRPLGHGYADFSDLDTSPRWIDQQPRAARRPAHPAVPVGVHAADRPRELRVQLLGGPRACRRAGWARRCGSRGGGAGSTRSGGIEPVRRAAEWPGRDAGRRSEPWAPGMGR